jgi:hypothetical protein
MSNPLNDVLPARARQIAYAVLFVASLVFATYQAADGDWVEFASGLVTALFGATAASNTNTGDAIRSANGKVAVHRNGDATFPGAGESE